MFTTKIYTEAGNYTVILTVTDDEGEKDTTWKVITVIPQQDGAAIDLYNQKGGQGPNQPDGAFALGETVTLTALLTYNKEPVQNKLVGFEVIDPTGEVVLDRSNITDAYGLATVNFTIPVLCLPNIFGTWTALATASVCEQNVSDMLTFKVRGPYIDVYTQKEPYNGQGPNEPSDAFAPQEEVILYAYVSYNCEPQQNKPVGFEVTNPSGEVIVDRTAFTNTEGIANITFRIPWPCENPEEAVFGTWTVLAKVSILELTAEDTLTFQVGWIIEITELKTVNATGVAKNSFAKGEHICFNLTARNIAFTSKTATFTLVAYDAESVPIGPITLHNWIIPPGTSVIFMISVQIPKWAYTGIAVAYANAYTELPQNCGTPFCPETSTIFMITKA
jgi:PKD repeat protein